VSPAELKRATSRSERQNIESFFDLLDFSLDSICVVPLCRGRFWRETGAVTRASKMSWSLAESPGNWHNI
jgi:hypothetical protein